MGWLAGNLMDKVLHMPSYLTHQVVSGRPLKSDIIILRLVAICKKQRMQQPTKPQQKRGSDGDGGVLIVWWWLLVGEGRGSMEG